MNEHYVLLGYIDLATYFAVSTARANNISGITGAVYTDALLPEPGNDLSKMIPIFTLQATPEEES